MKAVICPVCDACGEFVGEVDDEDTDTTVPCHGCGGRGWVEVSESNPYDLIQEIMADVRARLAQFMPTGRLELEMTEMQNKYARHV